MGVGGESRGVEGSRGESRGVERTELSCLTVLSDVHLTPHRNTSVNRDVIAVREVRQMGRQMGHHIGP